MQALIEFLSANPQLALAAVFGAALLEALAIIGTVIPGSSIVFVGGMLVGLRVLDPLSTTVAAITGATAGDGISFWLGRRYRLEIRTMWPMKSHPELFDRGEAYFTRRGGKSVFFARFLGPLRAIVPLIAGMSDMPGPRFYLVNALSAFAWAAAHLAPGFLFGASLQLAGAVSSRLLILLIAIAAVAWSLHRLFRAAQSYGMARLAALRDKAVAAASRRRGLLSTITLSLFDPARPASEALLTAAILLAGSVWLFGGVLEDVASHDPLVQFDQTVFSAFQGIRTAWADNVMVTITEAAGPVGTVALVVVVSALLIALRYWRTLAYWLVTNAFAEVLVWVVKEMFARQRPHNIYTGHEQYSLPSGHATLSIAVYGFMAFLLARGRPLHQRRLIALVAAVVILAISGSRLYLGVHWFSDVVASLSLGLAWIAVVSIAYVHHVSGERLRAVPVVLLMVATVTLVGGGYAAWHHDADIERYAPAKHTPVESLVAWRDGGWRHQPGARSELGGDVEEPFSVQWVGSQQQIAKSLDVEGWHVAGGLRPGPLLLALIPGTNIDQLPVFPKFHHGRVEHMTLVKSLDESGRLVLRLWRARIDIAIPGGDPPSPLWYGMVTIERAERAPRIGALPYTTSDFSTPLTLLIRDADHGGLSAASRNRNGEPLLLLW